MRSPSTAHRRSLVVSAALAALALGGCSLMEPKEDPALVKATQVEGRVAQVERQTQGMLELQRQIESLQAEVRQLRGEVEQAQYEAQAAKNQQRDLYADLDRRLQALESGAAAASSPAGGAAAGASAPAIGDREAYQSALDRLRAHDYATAEKVLREFPATYPQSTLLDNAKYWLGETYYVERRYDDALAAFQSVLADHPDSRKAPDAMLKAGYSQYELKKYREARVLLNRVVQAYPDTSAANDARDRLRRMDAEKR